MTKKPAPVVEYAAFRNGAARLLTQDEREELIREVSENPRVGKEYEGTGGIRVLKWPEPIKGRKEKVVLGYYFGDGSTPVLLVTLRKGNEPNMLSKIVKGLAQGN